MKNVAITCDNCERDLTITTNCEGFRLGLIVQSVPSCGGVVTAMACEPEIDGDHHFCGLKCLDAWLAKEWPRTQPQPEVKR